MNLNLLINTRYFFLQPTNEGDIVILKLPFIDVTNNQEFRNNEFYTPPIKEYIGIMPTMAINASEDANRNLLLQTESKENTKWMKFGSVGAAIAASCLVLIELIKNTNWIFSVNLLTASFLFLLGGVAGITILILLSGKGK